MAKNSFVIYTEYSRQLELLTMEQRGVLLTAMIAYQKGEPLPEMEPMTRMAFSFISSDMDANNEKYERAVEQRKEAGKKSAEARNASVETDERTATKSTSVHSRSTKSTSVHSVERTATKSTDNDNVSVNDLELVNDDNNIVRPEAGRLSDRQLEEEFEEVWSRYPRKDGKKEALGYYKRDRRKGVDKSDFVLGVARYNGYLKATGTTYIQMGSTFFNKQSWANEWKIPRASPENKQGALMEWLASKEGGTK